MSLIRHEIPPSTLSQSNSQFPAPSSRRSRAIFSPHFDQPRRSRGFIQRFVIARACPDRETVFHPVRGHKHYRFEESVHGNAVARYQANYYAERSNFQLNGVPKMLGRNGTVLFFLFLLPPASSFAARGSASSSASPSASPSASSRPRRRPLARNGGREQHGQTG